MTELVHEWKEVRERFCDSLVLGNGASIAIHQGFSYRSLREEADRRLLLSDVQRVFEALDTTDFEFVLRSLWYAKHVNDALGIEDRRTGDAYESVKRALISVVREAHPAFADVKDKLDRAQQFMSRFKTVISLNYDVLVYWALQLGNKKAPYTFKDCFIDGEFQLKWRAFRERYGGGSHSTLVFYPHGNVVIGANLVGGETKIHSDLSADLLSSVWKVWTKGEVIPVFVSEGTSEQKRASIRRSPYLSVVFEEVLPDLGKSVVLHGWSVGESDDHVLDAICRGRPNRFALGVDPNSNELGEFSGRVRRKLASRLGPENFELVLYDRGSPTCWVAA